MNEKLIYEHLKQMGQGQDLETLRNFSQALGKVVEYNFLKLNELSQHIDKEIKDPSQRFYIHATVAAGKEAALVNHFLFPMETEEDKVTVFLPWEQERIESLCKEKRQVIMEIEGQKYEETVWFRPVKRYFEMTEDLALEFYQNSIYCSNWNLPYLYKFLEIFREGGEEPVKEPVSAIWLNDIEEPLLTGLVPYWNVKKIELPCAVFPVPARDRSYFEHILEMPDADDGYIVTGQTEISQILFREKHIVIRTNLEDAKKWMTYQIISPEKKEITIPHYPFTTNQRIMRHTDRQAEQSVRMPCTKKEIFRILRSYQACETLKAKELTLLEGIPKGAIMKENLWSDSLRGFEKPKKEACIQIGFQVEKPDFTTREQIAFLMGELGIYFPEYTFAGDVI